MSWNMEVSGLPAWRAISQKGSGKKYKKCCAADLPVGNACSSERGVFPFAAHGQLLRYFRGHLGGHLRYHVRPHARRGRRPRPCERH
jgi:hypothetical protein